MSQFNYQNSRQERCPHCGSPNYVGGSFGGRCYDCGYDFGPERGGSSFGH